MNELALTFFKKFLTEENLNEYTLLDGMVPAIREFNSYSMFEDVKIGTYPITHLEAFKNIGSFYCL